MSKIYGYAKLCMYCGKPFEAKNKNAKFCSNGHRVTFWKIKHGVPLPDYTIRQIKNRIPSKIEKEIAEQTRQLQNVDEEIKRNKETIAKLTIEYNAVKDSINQINREARSENKIRVIRNNTIVSKLWEKRFSLYDFRDENVNSTMIMLSDMVNDRESKVQNLNEANEKLIEKADEINVLINKLRRGYNIETLRDEGKLMSVAELLSQETQTYQFNNNFNNVFGSPATSFIAMIHGSSGSGKSTFCIQFADYFSKNHGDTVYLSIEEGTNVSFINKLSQNVLGSSKFQVSEVRSPVKIREMSKSFKLIIVDSLSYAQFTEEDVEEICKFHQVTGTSFVFIMHETKGGTYRGGTFFEHLSDIFLEANEGIITATKNRYSAKENLSEYNVFNRKKEV